ncbi:type VI secretion system ImpA family N-terminal domain-containing protein, partial [Photobacterium damselae]
MSSMTTYREQLVNQIEGDDAVGLRIIDDPLLDFIDSQMMKVGSLSHADVQWNEVESCVVNLLSNKTKDIKLLTVLLQCLQHQPTPERFTLSIAVLVDFM